MLAHARSRRPFALSIAALAVVATCVSTGAAGPPRASGETAAKPRLVYGPQVYRLKPTGQKYGLQNETSYRYAVVYLPSRSIIGDTFQGEGRRSAGDISIAGVFAPDYTHDRLYAKRFRPQRCTVAYINGDDPDITSRDLRRLDRIEIGQPVRVTIRPLASALPDVSYGRTYHRTVRMRQGGKYTLTEAAVQRQLETMHCARR